MIYYADKRDSDSDPIGKILGILKKLDRLKFHLPECCFPIYRVAQGFLKLYSSYVDSKFDQISCPANSALFLSISLYFTYVSLMHSLSLLSISYQSRSYLKLAEHQVVLSFSLFPLSLTHTLSFSLSPPFFVSYSLSLFFSLHHTHTLPHSPSLFFLFTLSLTHTHSLTNG